MMSQSQSQSQCAIDGQNSRSCSSVADDSASFGCDGSGEIMLFGVRVKVDPMRKSVSMNNLSQYQQPGVHESANNQNLDVSAAVAADNGYASADDAVRNQTNGSRERKRGIPWTEEEHKLFLVGLQKVGKGDWRGISRNFVKTRTPTQVASHAQKYFLRRSNLNRRRRRSSLFDITTDSVSTTPMEEHPVHENINGQPTMQSPMQISPLSGFPMAAFPAKDEPVPSPVQNQMKTITFSNGEHQLNRGPTSLIRAAPLLPTPNPPTRADLNLNQEYETGPSPLSLSLSLAYNHNQSSPSHSSAFQVISGFNNGDGIISAA